MKGDETLWLIIGGFLIIALIGALNPNSQIGSAVATITGTINKLFGTQGDACPFINIYANKYFSLGTREYIKPSDYDKNPLKYAGTEYDIAYRCLALATKYDTKPNLMGPTPEKIEITIREKSQDEEPDWSGDVENAWIVEYKATYKGETDSEHKTEKSWAFSEYRNRLENCIQELSKPGKEKGSKTLSKAYTRIRSFFKYKIPPWQCALIYGLLPFIIIFNFVQDILDFTMMSGTTKKLIAAFAAILAILTGAIANVTATITKFVGLSIGGSFLMLMLMLALLSMLLGQIAVTSRVATETLNAVESAAVGALSLAAVAAGFKGANSGGRKP